MCPYTDACINACIPWHVSLCHVAYASLDVVCNVCICTQHSMSKHASMHQHAMSMWSMHPWMHEHLHTFMRICTPVHAPSPVQACIHAHVHAPTHAQAARAHSWRSGSSSPFHAHRYVSLLSSALLIKPPYYQVRLGDWKAMEEWLALLHKLAHAQPSGGHINRA